MQISTNVHPRRTALVVKDLNALTVKAALLVKEIKVSQINM